MQINSIGPSFGSALTIRNIYLDGERVYTKYSPRMDSNSEKYKLVKAIMKSLRLNLKEPVDTPVAKKMNELIPDLYYKYGKNTTVLMLPDLSREVNLLTGEDAFTYDNIMYSQKLDRIKKGKLLENLISEMFGCKKSKDPNARPIFAGLFDIYASSRDMIEKEGKKLHELIAIDDVAKALE